jgi:toxin-antitoxin system PIN domain toxin
MLLFDVNILVHAFREDSPRHQEVRQWLEGVLGEETSFGVADLVLSGFIRVVTHPRVFDPPAPLERALDLTEAILAHPGCVVIRPGPRHWRIFLRLCRETDARGNLVPDAYLAALAIESGSEWITFDRDFARFPGLRWRPPFGSP